MPRTRYAQFTFTAGEIDPQVASRVDFEKYYKGAGEVLNALPTVHGVVARRPGTHFLGEVKNSADPVRIVGFTWKGLTSYLLEFGPAYMRVYKNGGVVLNATDLITNGTFNTAITGWTDNSTGSATMDWHSGAGKPWNSGTMRLIQTVGDSAEGYQAITTVASTEYRLDFTSYTEDLASPLITVRIGTTAGGSEIALQTFEQGVGLLTFTATGTTTYITFVVSGNGVQTTAYVDDVSCQATAVIYELATPYTAAELPTLAFVPSSDRMYVLSSLRPPRELIPTGDAAWTIPEVAFTPPPLYEYGVEPPTTVTPGATTGSGITFTAGTGTFLTGDVGREIVHLVGAGRAVITAVPTGGGDTTCTCDIVEDFPSTSAIASGDWKLDISPTTQVTPSKSGPVGAVADFDSNNPAFRAEDQGSSIRVSNGIADLYEYVSNVKMRGRIRKILSGTDAAPGGTWSIERPTWTAARGYPRMGIFFEQRLILASTETQPTTIWGSANGDFTNMGIGTNDDDAIEFTIAAASPLRWFAALREMFIGTLDREYRMSGGPNEAIKPTSVLVRAETSVGGDAMLFSNAVALQNSALFINAHRNRVFEMVFSLDRDTFIANDLTTLAPHLISTIGQKINHMVFQREAFPVIWVTRDDGLLLTCTFLRDHDVVGWARQHVGGSVERIARIPHWNEAYDAVFAIVRRTINGATKRYIEYFDRSLNVDSGLVRVPTGTPVTTITGLDHLEGETVRVVGDGVLQTSKVVSGGSISIDSADAVEVGLNFNSRLVPLRPELPVANQTTFQGLAKRWSSYFIRWYQTLNAKVNGVAVTFPATNDTTLYGQSVYTGDIEVTLRGIDADGEVTIEQTDPLPWTVAGVFGELHVDDDRRNER